MPSSLRYYLAVLFNVFIIVNSQRAKDKMFSSIAGASCFKRLNGTHETGCSSAMGGSVGVLHLIKSSVDFEFITKNPPSPPYAVVVTPQHFSRENILPLKNSPFVSAIVLINNHKGMTQFSQELRCPNQYSSYNNQTCDAAATTADSTNVWNPFGTGLLHENFPFPIYYVADPDEILKITNCFEKFNAFDLPAQHNRPLCAIQINSFMSASVNSEVCLRRTGYSLNVNPPRYCDPLQSFNIYATLYPRETVSSTEQRQVQINEKFILVSARLDTTSMFDGMGFGAYDSLVSYTTLISVAHILRELLPEKYESDNPNVLFVVFNGESYDYIGSQRFVYDLKKGSFPIGHHSNPISMDNIELMIDIGTLDDINNIQIIHRRTFSMSTKFINTLVKYNDNYSFRINTKNSTAENLPPTSAQSFLRENKSFPVVILNSKPTNQFYHSIYDDMENIGYKYLNSTLNNFTKLSEIDKNDLEYPMDSIQMAIRNVSSLLAFTLFEMVSGQEYHGNMGGNPVLVDELLFCWLESAACPLFKAILRPDSHSPLPIPPLRYVSVHGSITHEPVAWTYRTLGYLVGYKVDLAEDNCTELPFAWYAGTNGTGECYHTTQNFSHARSPAFIIPNYDWTSGRYSTWTESTWREINARIFLKPSTSQEALTLSIGFVVMLISFVAVFLINTRSDILFGDCISTDRANTFTAPAQC